MQQREPHEYSKIIEEISFKVPVEDVYAQLNMNQEQEQGYNTILIRVNSEIPMLIFVDGPRITGKTFLCWALLPKVRSNGKITFTPLTSGVQSRSTGVPKSTRFETVDET